VVVIFKALAVWGGLKKLVIVISPLKALECDQVFKLAFQVIMMLNFCFRQNTQPTRELMLLLLMKTHPRLLSFGNKLAPRLQSLICPLRWCCPRASRNFGRICNFVASLQHSSSTKPTVLRNGVLMTSDLYTVNSTFFEAILAMRLLLSLVLPLAAHPPSILYGRL
jgi:hypothetical protein